MSDHPEISFYCLEMPPGSAKDGENFAIFSLNVLQSSLIGERSEDFGGKCKNLCCFVQSITKSLSTLIIIHC